MNLLDEEVFAVILAVVVVGSVFAIAMYLRPENPEPFTAIGLLNEECKIGDYPVEVFNDTSISLCIFVDNHLDEARLFEIRYKIADNTTIPTNTTPSPRPVVKRWDVFLDKYQNRTFRINIPVYMYGNQTNGRVALVFELWVLDPGTGEWQYTGRWVHLYVQVVPAPL